MRLVILILLLIPTYSYANEVVSLIGYGLIKTGGWWSVIGYILVIASAVYGSEQSKKAAEAQQEAKRREYNAGLRERTVTRVATDAPFRYIYGRARVGSDIIAMFSSGDRDEYKNIVCVHAAHECDAIEEIYVNGVALGTLDVNGDVTSGIYGTYEEFSVTESHTGTSFILAHEPVQNSLSLSYFVPKSGRDSVPYTVMGVPYTIVGSTVTVGVSRTYTCRYSYYVFTPRVRVTKHLGSATDPADAALVALNVGWNSSSVVRGFCYTVIRINLNQKEFQSGIPSIEALIRGKKILDVRTSTTAYSANPALVIYDYLTSEMCGLSAASLPTADYITAANVCDETISINGVQSYKYAFDGTVTADQAPAKTLELMAQSMAGGIVKSTRGCWAGKYVAPVMALDQSDIVGSLSIISGTPDADIYNGVRGQYVGTDNNYVVTDFTPYTNSAYVTSDGRELWTNIEFPYTNRVQRIHNLCRIFCEDQRNGFTIKAEFSLKAWALKVGQRVTFTSTLFGQSAKIYRVTDKKYGPDQAVELTLKEDAASIWDTSDAVTADETPNSNLPNPFVVSELTQLTCSSGETELLILLDGTIISRILAAWVQPASYYVQTIEVEWRKFGDTAWNKTIISGTDTKTHLSPVEDSAFYNVRARSVNALDIKSNWYYAEPHQVIGKTSPPPNITGLNISGTVLNWTPVDVLDLAGYVFKFHYGNNTDWGTANNLHGGIITETLFDLLMRPNGVVTIMGKAIDTTGNESLITSNIFTNLGDAPIANIVETINFDPTFAGTLTGCTVSGGDVVADALDAFYGTDAQSFYGAIQTDSFYEPSSYGAMTYHTDDVSIASALVGSIMTLQHSTQGSGVNIEYHYESQTPFYGLDADSFYGIDADPFYDAPGDWLPWPGQLQASNEIFSFQISIGAGIEQGKIFSMSLVIDAPDMTEELADVAISSLGTTIPYTKNFTAIKTVQATLQANGSGAETIEVDKVSPLAPSIKAYNSAHTAVSGSTADITIRGY
jgi:hypothetical protein